MNIGDLVKIKKRSIMMPDDATIGIIVDVWKINNYNWLRILWDVGRTDSVAENDIELL